MDLKKYYIGNEDQTYNLTIVTGACRSGKTTFCRILGSMSNTEWIEEPYALSLFLKYIQIDRADATTQRWRSQVFGGLCKELVNDTVLLRNGNFRPNDLSTIWNYKEVKEIFHRLVNVNTRSQVEEYVKENGNQFVIDVPEVLNSTGFMKEAYSNLRVIHIVRNPYDVAEAVVQKHWFSDENLKHPHMNYVYQKYFCKKDNTTYFVPSWVEEEQEQDFINASEYERGIMYWLAQTENKEHEHSDIVIKYEDIVCQPLGVVQTLYKWGFKPTSRTNMLCDELCMDYISGLKRELNLNQNYMERFVRLKEKYGYE